MNNNTRLAIIVVFLWALTAVAFGQANQWGPYDPGAARSTLSNVAPATGRAALELGTMAVATATDYVATDTSTGHTDATGASVHGLGTISTKADTDYVATSSLAARVDTINASFTGSIDVAGDVGAATLGVTGHSTGTTASISSNLTVGGTINSVDFSEFAAAQGYPADTTVYGVEIDLTTPSAPVFTRLAGAVGKTAGADFDGIGAFSRRRCNLADNGTVNDYYGDAGYTENGSNGQVMVEQPRFYYKVVPMKSTPISGGAGSHLIKARYYISDSMIEGFKVHPAFVKDGIERPVIYLSAYEGSIYQTATAAYLLNDEQVVSFTVDKLCSIAGAKPASGLTQNLTRANARKLASNRGAKWSLATVQSVSASQLLFLVEYATFNTQAAIGRGVTDKTDDGSTNMSNVTGATTALGNGSGAAAGTDGLVSISYRGEENFWGNIWKWVDGLNVYAYSTNYAYIADHGFADDTSTGYANAGFTLAKANGYISAFGYSRDYDWLFLPSAVAGSDSNPVGDYFYQSNTTAGFLVALLGGVWSNGSAAGGCYWDLNAASSVYHRSVGARSLHVP